MKKKRKVRTFAGRLTWRIVLVLLIIMGLTSYWLFVLGASFAQEEEIFRHEAMVKATTENICRVVSDVYVAVRNQLPEIEESLDRPDRMMTLVERTIAQNPRIRSCGISFIEDFYPNKGRCYMPYAVRRDSNSIEVSDIGTKCEDYFREDWFLDALKAEEGYWSEPFFEKNDSTLPLVAYLHPIRDKQGRPVAVIGADISLDWLREKMKEADWKLYTQQWAGMTEKRREKEIKEWMAYSMLVSKKGTFIVHPDEKRIIHDSIGSIAKASKDTVVTVMVQRIMEGKASKNFELINDNNYSCKDFEGRDGYVFYKPIKHTGWSMVLFAPEMALDLIAYVIGGILVFFILLAVLIVWLVTRISIKRTTKPLKQLSSSANEVAKGNFDTLLPNIKHNDEIRLLRDSFEDMQHSLTKYVSELQTTTASKAAIENELKVAHDIQMAMLPKIFPPFPERKDVDIYGSLTPAKEVGGDLFDFFIIDNSLFFCIGDVSGKGVPASLVMAVTRSLFRNVATHTSEPDQIVSALNEALADGNETNMFVTLFVGILDLTSGHMRYCNAGHDAPLLIGQNVSLVPCNPNLPLGAIQGSKYSLQELTLEPQTTIFLYTDGLNEAEDIKHVQFGTERVMSLAEELLSEDKNRPAEIIERMTEAVRDFVGEAVQSDDLTMLAIKYLKSDGNQGKEA
ncbi:MAG: SpoIIE family protein phosphatase [Prevotella sp.]|nr:SpoIIE family protein phosphatase [Prevotella sp.]